MHNTMISFTVIALIAAPSLSAAQETSAPAPQSMATSLSASFGSQPMFPPPDVGTLTQMTGEPSFPPRFPGGYVDSETLGSVTAPQSVSIASATGTYAVAASAATSGGSSAVSGASTNGEGTPQLEAVLNLEGNGYETYVDFEMPQIDPEELRASICGSLEIYQDQEQQGSVVYSSVVIDAEGQTIGGLKDSSVTTGALRVDCRDRSEG
jgi:hypothetical protein